MRVDAIPFANKNQAQAKSPRYIIEIDFSDEILRLTGSSDTPVPSDGNDVEHGTFRVVSSSSQKIDPNIGKSTIGGITFEAIDLSSNITAKIRDKLATDALGLQNKTVTFKYGYDGLTTTEFQTVETQQIQDVKLRDGKYIFKCEDIQRAAKKQIFDEVKTTLAANLTVDETSTITVFDTSDFSLVEHGTSYSDAPSATVGYVEIKQGDKREVIRYTGSTSSTFTTLTRGVLNTRAQAFTFDSGGADNGITVRQFVYIELPILKMAYALLTGDLIGQSSKVLPAEWHLNIAPTWVDQSQFTDHLDLYDSSDDTAGFIVRFEGVPRSDGKTFIEKELMVLAGAFMPVQADGALGLKRMADVQPDAGYVGVLDSSNVVSYGSLHHSMRDVFNKMVIDWNYSVARGEFSRTNILVDAVSQATHGESKTKRLKFRGLYGSRHSASILDTVFNVLRDRYAGPPLRIPLTCLPGTNVYEVGDTVRVRLPIEDYTSTATLDRSFEVQRRTINWLTGLVVFDLFSSSQRATLITPTATSFIATGYYSTGLTAGNEINATNFPGDVTSSGGVTTISADITLAGNADMNNNAAIYWCTEALTLNAGVTVTINKNVQIRALGHFTINGDIDGTASSDDLTITGYCGAMVEAQWGINFEGSYYKSQATDMAAPLQRAPLYELVPFLNIQQDANGIASGIPGDCRGISGAQGGRVFHVGPNLEKAAGGAGGEGGAGLVIVSKGGSFGGSGAITLSGGPGIKGGTHLNFAKNLHAGCGSPGGPGACHWIVDGQSSTIPTLSLNFVGKYGVVDLDVSTPGITIEPIKYPNPGGVGVTDSSIVGLNPTRIDGVPSDAAAVDISQSVQRVQVVAGYVAAAEDVDDPLADLTADEIEALLDGKNATYNQATAPTIITHPELKVGDTWWATVVLGLFVWDGVDWDTRVGDVTGDNTAADTVLVDGTAAATVKTGAGLGATANQDSTVTILGGDLTGTIDGTTGSVVVTGAGLGATANQDSTSAILAGNLTGTLLSVAISAYLNANISIDTAGLLDGAGGGQVTIGGLGFLGSLTANDSPMRMGLRLNKDSFTNPNNGEGYIHGRDDDGVDSDTNGVLLLPEGPHTMLGTAVQARNIYGGSTFAGSLYIIYDKGNTKPWTSFSGATNVILAYQDDDGTWKYDNNGAPGVTFPTITSNMYAIGTVTKPTGDGAWTGGSVWGFGIQMASIVELGADVTSAQTAADTTLVSGTAAATVEAGAVAANAAVFPPTGQDVTWVYDGTDQSPTSTTQDVDVVFKDIAGAADGGTTTVRFTFDGATDDNDVSGAEFGTNANTVVASHAGGGVNDGYETMKVTHTASGVIAYIYGSRIYTAGSGGK